MVIASVRGARTIANANTIAAVKEISKRRMTLFSICLEYSQTLVSRQSQGNAMSTMSQRQQTHT